jgi:anti-sigma factor RsiW
MKCEEARELLEAFHDGELTVETRSALAAHLKACEACRATLSQLGALSAAIKSVDAFPVPESLQRNVEKHVSEAARERAVPVRRMQYGLLAASYIAVALAGGLMTYGWLANRTAHNFKIDEAVSAHVRSLMDNNLVQVASSDTHTVRPWFAGKIDFSPDVRDLAAVGFPLVGGRVDYVGAVRVAALVYTHNKHVITVFVAPAPSFGVIAPNEARKNGYTIVEWRAGDLSYRAVSDLEAAELNAFVRSLQTPSSF